MCQIFFTHGEGVPSEKLLAEAAQHNSHGAGVMWYADNQTISWQKGMNDPEEAIKLFLSLDKATRAIHFRSASVGGIKPELTHPFVIDGKASSQLRGSARRVLMHNGTWSAWKDVLLVIAAKAGKEIPRGPWSDSRAMAFITDALGPGVWDVLDLESRILIFDREDMIRKCPPAMFGKWIDSREGWWHSQEFFRYRNYSSTDPTTWSGGTGPSGFRVEDRRGGGGGNSNLAQGEAGKAQGEAREAPQVRMITPPSSNRPGRPFYSTDELHSILGMMIIARKAAGRPAPPIRGVHIDA